MAIKFSREQWQKIQPVVDEALALEEGQREAFVQQKCRDEPWMYSLVHGVLQSNLAQGTLHAFDTGAKADKLAWHLGQELAGYRLTGVLGMGGMGIVYLAQRIRGDFERDVAIKLLHSMSEDSRKRKQHLQRFNTEQQALALLQHPQIAKLYEAGLTAEQQPYFIMEYVDGENIMDYCQQHNLGTKQKVGLLIQIAEILGYAHQNLIVHRDIKPSNILVNRQGEVKLLDFGIAKMLAADKQQELTQTGEAVMTIGSAAPEQIKNLPITVATDIFQLALVGYEMLTGQKAYSDKAKTLFDMATLVCQETPTPPSQMVEQGMGYGQINGELDAILLKALSHEPRDRYATMQDFAADLSAYLTAGLVLAHQPNALYRLKKQFVRHRKAVLLILTFVSLLFAYATTVTLQSAQLQQALGEAELAAKKAESVSDFMVEIFKQSDPNVRGLETVTATQLLESGEMKLRQTLHDAPEIRAHMLSVYGDIYYSQSQYQRSAQLLREALSHDFPSTPLEQIKRTNLTVKLAISLSTLDEYDEARSLLLQSIDNYQGYILQPALAHRVSEFAVNYAEAMNALANLQRMQGQYERADDLHKKALEFVDDSAEGKNERAVALNGLAFIAHFHGRFEEAIANMQGAAELVKQIHGEQHSYYTMALNNLVTILTDLEYFQQATNYSEQALEIQRNLFGAEHQYVAKTLRGLGLLAHRQGDFDAARNYLRSALIIQRANQNEDDLNAAVIQLWLGAVLQDSGDFAQAQQMFEAMLATFRKHGASDRLIGRALCQPASLALAQGDLPGALERYSLALNLLPANGVRTSIAQLGWAKAAYLLKHDLTEARKKARSALEVRKSKFPPGHSLIAQAEGILGLLLFEEAPQDAQTLLRSSLQVLSKRRQFVQRVDQYNLVALIQDAL